MPTLRLKKRPQIRQNAQQKIHSTVLLQKLRDDLTGTILEKCRLTPRKALLILYLYFTGNYSASKIAREVQVDVKTAYLFTRKAREQAKFFQELVDSLRSR